VITSRQLAEGWSIQAAAEVTESGAVVSTTGFDAGGWFATSVPSTPMAALVANGLYPDLYLGTNLEEVDTGQFKGPWWYRTEFEISAEDAVKVARPSTTRPISGSTASSWPHETPWLAPFESTSST